MSLRSGHRWAVDGRKVSQVVVSRLLVLAGVVLAGLPAVVHGQGAQIPQYPTSVDPYEVIIFEHDGYTGSFRSFKLDPTMRQLLVPFLDSEFDGRISSIRVGDKVGVVVFDPPKFQEVDTRYRQLVMIEGDTRNRYTARASRSRSDGRFSPFGRLPAA